MKTINELMIINAIAERDARTAEMVEFMSDNTWFTELEARLAEGGPEGELTALEQDIMELMKEIYGE